MFKKIEPLFNRLIVFDTHDKSWHGLPDPVNFPEDVPRRSILLYYYTKEPRPDAQIKIKQPHSALWKKRDLKISKEKKPEILLRVFNIRLCLYENLNCSSLFLARPGKLWSNSLERC